MKTEGRAVKTQTSNHSAKNSVLCNANGGLKLQITSWQNSKWFKIGSLQIWFWVSLDSGLWFSRVWVFRAWADISYRRITCLMRIKILQHRNCSLTMTLTNNDLQDLSTALQGKEKTHLGIIEVVWGSRWIVIIASQRACVAVYGTEGKEQKNKNMFERLSNISTETKSISSWKRASWRILWAVYLPVQTALSHNVNHWAMHTCGGCTATQQHCEQCTDCSRLSHSNWTLNQLQHTCEADGGLEDSLCIRGVAW